MKSPIRVPTVVSLDRSGQLRWQGRIGAAIEHLESRTHLSVSLKPVIEFTDSGGNVASGGLTADAAGNLYGTTVQGPGAAGLGTVYEIPIHGGGVKTLATFNGFNGESPECRPIVDSAGNLFGTATFGGNSNFNPGHADGYGSVFEVPVDSGKIKVLASFNGKNGDSPQGNLIRDSHGNFYGVTEDGGTGFNGNELTGDGTVFEIPAAGGAVKALAFFNGTNGNHPSGPLIADAAGDFFGTTLTGGAYGDGTIFELPAGGKPLKTLMSFNGKNGSQPSGGLAIDSASNLFGTTGIGGASSDGTVFELPAGGKPLKTLATFNGKNGSGPWNGVIADAAGNLYGTADGSKGTVFEVPVNSGIAKTIATFNGLNGDAPDSALLVDKNGNLYGTTWGGGPGYKPPYVDGDGVVFEVTGAGFALMNLTAPAAQSATAGKSHAFSLGTLAIAAAPGPYKDTINWGDGSANTILTLSTATLPTAAHTYVKTGTFSVTETVVDSAGVHSNIVTFKVNVTALATKLGDSIESPSDWWKILGTRV